MCTGTKFSRKREMHSWHSEAQTLSFQLQDHKPSPPSLYGLSRAEAATSLHQIPWLPQRHLRLSPRSGHHHPFLLHLVQRHAVCPALGWQDAHETVNAETKPKNPKNCVYTCIFLQNESSLRISTEATLSNRFRTAVPSDKTQTLASV